MCTASGSYGPWPGVQQAGGEASCSQANSGAWGKQPSNAAKRASLPQLPLLRVGCVCSVTPVVMAVFLSPGSPRAGREGIPVLGMLGLGWRCRGSGEAAMGRAGRIFNPMKPRVLQIRPAMGRAGRICNTLGFIGLHTSRSFLFTDQLAPGPQVLGFLLPSLFLSPLRNRCG